MLHTTRPLALAIAASGRVAMNPRAASAKSCRSVNGRLAAAAAWARATAGSASLAPDASCIVLMVLSRALLFYNRSDAVAGGRRGNMAAKQQKRAGTWLEVLGAFGKLGLTSFGGPVAHLGYFR